MQAARSMNGTAKIAPIITTKSSVTLYLAPRSHIIKNYRDSSQLQATTLIRAIKIQFRRMFALVLFRSLKC